MIIEIKGVQFVNKGAELMLHAIIDKIKTLWPHADICLVSDENSPYLSRARIGAYQKLNVCKNIIDLNGLFYFCPVFIRNYLKNNWGIVTEADVDVLLDASGFNYGDQWNTIILRQAAIKAARFKRMNKHYIFMPQALGPFSSFDNKKAAREAFEAATIVFAREQNSFDFAKKCSEKANVSLAGDFTNLVTPKLPERYLQLKNMVAIVPNSKMVSLKNKNKSWRDNYISILLSVVNAFIEKGEKVFLLNHEGKADHAICEEINALLTTPLEIIAPTSSLDVKAIISQSKAVFCSRYHGCVSALSNGIPCIGSSWSHKYERLYSEYGVEKLLLLSEVSSEEIIRLVDHVIDDKKDINKALIPYLLQFKNNSELMWAKVYRAITKS